MKIIHWKVYKEIKLKELDKEELLEIIEDLQKRVDKLENRWYNWLTWVCTTNPLSTKKSWLTALY